ncbi:alpha-L-rhamnosidase C-terminal domain-containing protein [Parafrankia sp. BMG5.11]|uniref:alpha-L-rhamnosidase-related protein n=1 Tax=Parafrankia sp. BMG5.11 TaxID=222540 RepID=UPI00103E047C|nr:alpha-L-rhamnosidase C-terminal domain-containing protein [Parafrankia sp. BMG5.11]TCJ37067.1 hypothetical protein E0504_18430 [Parafrankia sp. BMG5.11]
MPGLAADDIPVVLLFRRELTLDGQPKSFPVQVTADNRFILYVNGQRIAEGPSTGDLDHWRVERIDLAPHLRAGDNVIAAKVWNGVKPLTIKPDATPREAEMARGRALFTQTAPAFQHSAGTGFRLVGAGPAAEVSTGEPGWSVARDAGHNFANGWAQVRRYYYVAGAVEKIDAAKSPADWMSTAPSNVAWSEPVAAKATTPRTLVLDKLPQQMDRVVNAGAVVRSDVTGGDEFPTRPVVIPPNSMVKLLIDRKTMVAAYPELSVEGGAGADISMTYSEALFNEKGDKGDRNLIGDRKIMGLTDTFTADGSRRSLGPLWWRVWRFMEIGVQTKGEQLTLEGLRVTETGYPFTQVGSFKSDDPQLEKIFDIGWRTQRIDAHETFMDSSFWEQLQYVGDTRLQMLISYAVAGDPRLAENAIDQIAASRGDGGLVEGAAPTRNSNVIATFSPMWVAMLDDWRMHQPDPAPIVRNLARMREVLGWIDKWQGPSGLLTKNPEWNFVDWAGQPSTDRSLFPSYGKAHGESCLTTAVWLGALQQGSRIENQFGDAALSQRYAATAQRMQDGIRKQCWSAKRGLYADNPDLDQFSQHMNALAVLYDVADRDAARQILGRITAPGKGIDAPEGMREVSYYYSWYLARALEHAGTADRYLDLLQTWRDLLALNYTTWPEERGKTRSDTHAWSAHPTADLLGIVAGIGPGSPGYRSVRIAPNIGQLRSVDAVSATPAGPVTVSYRRDGSRLTADIGLPAGLTGEFVWAGRTYPLTKRKSAIVLDSAD